MRANSWTIDLRAVVVVPDHVHLIFIPPVDIQKSEVFSLARLRKPSKALQRT
jgi:hypothetical protein